MIPGGKPDTELPAETPTFPPLITVEPVLATAAPAKTAKLLAVPRFTSCALALGCSNVTANAKPSPMSMGLAPFCIAVFTKWFFMVYLFSFLVDSHLIPIWFLPVNLREYTFGRALDMG